jgi:hypothetical protein
MTERPADARRFQVSVRGILAATAVLALLMVPITWVARERERMRQAREDAIRAVVLAERYRSKLEERTPIHSQAAARVQQLEAENAESRHSVGRLRINAAARIEQLEVENAELKDTIELLRKEVERLKGQGR